MMDAINQLMFREYDIRGIAGEDLSVALVENIGRTFATHVASATGNDTPSIAIGRDGRLSSPELGQALAKGLADAGASVIDVQLVPTPALYYAIHHFQADGGIMITGSHNPPEYNGLKMVRQGAPVFGAEIQQLLKRLLDNDFNRDRIGDVRQEDVIDLYADRIFSDFKPGRPVKVVFDFGNGAAGAVAKAVLSRFPESIQVESLFEEVDGTFPNHHPDPTIPKNLVDLKARMREMDADLGVAFDGDGDRIGALDEQQQIIWGDRMMVLFARDILKRKPGAAVIGDVKCSQVLFDAIDQAGGEAIMWKTGHSLVKAKMRETGAPLAGEMSGHLFFADRYYGYDDALYAAIRLIELLVAKEGSLSSRLNDLPEVYATPELRLFCPDDQKFAVMERIAASQSQREDVEVSQVDGIRIRYPDGWWLLRVSNTQPAMVARVEAKSEQRLDAIAKEVAAILKKENVEFPDWRKES
ncbi:phosphomannomutase/phosphoglucomutase [Magnetococcales bacterium HHB-1]